MCTAEESKKYYHRNLEKCRESSRIRAKQRRHKSPIKYIMNLARNRARLKGIKFNIEDSDITIPEFCPVLGIPLYYQLEGKHNGSPSLDRIDSNKGYIKGNVRVISYRANLLKCNATIEELELVLEDLKKLEVK